MTLWIYIPSASSGSRWSGPGSPRAHGCRTGRPPEPGSTTNRSSWRCTGEDHEQGPLHRPDIGSYPRSYRTTTTSRAVLQAWSERVRGDHPGWYRSSTSNRDETSSMSGQSFPRSRYEGSASGDDPRLPGDEGIPEPLHPKGSKKCAHGRHSFASLARNLSGYRLRQETSITPCRIR